MPAECSVVEQIDTHLKALSSKKREWALLPLRRKIDLLLEVRERMITNLYLLGKESAEVRGLAGPGPISAEGVSTPLTHTRLASGAPVSQWLHCQRLASHQWATPAAPPGDQGMGAPRSLAVSTGKNKRGGPDGPSEPLAIMSRLTPSLLHFRREEFAPRPSTFLC
ncbi:MAG: hypothetical protein WDW38_003659 [Sanguina aurantia]